MKERGILFSAPMVRALLTGSKTQTRRPLKPLGAHTVLPLIGEDNKPTGSFGWCPNANVITDHIHCPYGMPGDRLWVRETWQFHGGMLDGGTGRASDGGFLYKDAVVSYPADGARVTLHPNGQDWPTPAQPPQREGEVYSLRDAPDDFRYDGENTYCDRLTRWWNRKIPAIHMYRWASRITLEVTEVRVERLQDISDDDLAAEGIQELIDAGVDHDGTPRDTYRALWEALNGPGSWKANPFVWAVSFKRVTP